MLKKILSAVGAFVLGVSLGLIVWLFAFNGIDKIQARTEFPDKPQGKYDGFYYKNLNDNEKIAYELIMKEIKTFPEKIHVPELDEKGLSNVFDALHYDNENFFFLDENCTIESTSFGTSYFVPEYTMNLAEYNFYMSELEKVKDEVLESTSNLTDDYDKELYVHDYIIEKCRYVEKVGGTYSSSYGCLVKGVASCEGYAKAMKYLLEEMGIENYIASGTTENDEGKDEGHAWNIVKINSEYYHVDATWNDPVNSEVENKYAYFNVNDKMLSKTHKIDECFIGLCEKDDENYYVKNSLVFSKYDGKTRNAITSEFARQIRLGNDTMSFKVTDKKVLNEAKEALFEMNGIYTILFSASSIADKLVSQENISYAIDEKHMIIIISDYLK